MTDFLLKIWMIFSFCFRTKNIYYCCKFLNGKFNFALPIANSILHAIWQGREVSYFSRERRWRHTSSNFPKTEIAFPHILCFVTPLSPSKTSHRYIMIIHNELYLLYSVCRFVKQFHIIEQHGSNTWVD